jgi:dTDP-4-dehydrorhamnose 3,5-epimerase-like enzyme
MPAATVEEVRLATDRRGLVFEPIDDALLPAQRNVHVVLTEPGAVRGNHFHEHGTEIAIVVGPALVRVREEGTLRDVPVPAGVALRFTFPPRVSHAFQNTGTAPMLLVAFNTAVFDREHPDVHRDVLIA